MTATQAVRWSTLRLDAFSVAQLYAVLRLRSEVFVVEQNCVFLDVDGLDDQAMHLLGHDADGALVAYARCFDRGVTFAEASIGRVITRGATRGSGLGHVLIDRAIALLHNTWGAQPIRIGAQVRLKNFYAGHGFVDVDRPYCEDGIDHLEMLWQPESRTEK